MHTLPLKSLYLSLSVWCKLPLIAAVQESQRQQTTILLKKGCFSNTLGSRYANFQQKISSGTCCGMFQTTISTILFHKLSTLPKVWYIPKVVFNLIFFLKSLLIHRALDKDFLDLVYVKKGGFLSCLKLNCSKDLGSKIHSFCSFVFFFL